MERLTKRWGNNCVPTKLNLDIMLTTSNEQADRLMDIVKKLAEYEDAEEQGLLLRLPCKVGSTLYQYQYINRQIIEREYKVIGLVFDIYRDKWLYEIAYQIGVEWRKTVCDFDAIGLTVFLTKEEAEQKLAEYKGE